MDNEKLLFGVDHTCVIGSNKYHKIGKFQLIFGKKSVLVIKKLFMHHLCSQICQV